MGKTDGRTDTVPFHRPRSAYYADSASEVTTLWRYTNLFIIIIIIIIIITIIIIVIISANNSKKVTHELWLQRE